MSDKLGITFDASMVIANFPILKKLLKKAPLDSVEDVAYEALRLSQFEVPHDEGTLQNSGTVEQVGNDFVLGYHTPYAARLHEHPEYRFQKGRKGKYISDPIEKNARALGIVANDTMGREVSN